MTERTVLIVEDNDDNRTIYSAYLAYYGLRVLEAVDGEQGLALARAAIPDVILMDMRMPELDGYQTTSRLKANPALKHIPVIAVTASSFREEEARARKTCDGFIRKPFNRAELIAELGRFLNKVQRHDAAKPISVPDAQTGEAVDAVPGTMLARWPEMIAKLRQEQSRVWPELCQTLELRPVEDFAARLRSLQPPTPPSWAPAPPSRSGLPARGRRPLRMAAYRAGRACRPWSRSWRRRRSCS